MKLMDRLLMELRRIDGAPNFRRVPLTFTLNASGQCEPDFNDKMAVGSGMPTING